MSKYKYCDGYLEDLSWVEGDMEILAKIERLNDTGDYPFSSHGEDR